MTGIAPLDRSAQDASLSIEDRFAIVPEWLLDAEVSDCAVRLYAVLLRYGQVSGARMPSRATLARRLRKRSTDTVDRALRELVEAGAVSVQARWSGRERLTNAYRVRTSAPTGQASPQEPAVERGGRIAAAASTTPTADTSVRALPDAEPSDRNPAATRAVRGGTGRTIRATVAAPMRHNPESSTESPSSPPRPPTIATECGIDNWASFVADCLAARQRVGMPSGRWNGPCLDAALQLAVRVRQWPAEQAAAALSVLAADPATRSPMRVAEAGPWWDGPAAHAAPDNCPKEEEVSAAEDELAEAGGLRVVLQRQARAQLAAEGLPVRRATVAVRAAQLLHDRTVVGVGA